MTNNLKHLYNLREDTSNSNSGLSIWYNLLIDKPMKDITVADVSKMIRQDILPEFAIDKSIELLSFDPFNGEMLDGDLMVTVVKVLKLPDINRNSNREKLKYVIEAVENSLSGFEWTNGKSNADFIDSLSTLKKLL